VVHKLQFTKQSNKRSVVFPEVLTFRHGGCVLTSNDLRHRSEHHHVHRFRKGHSHRHHRCYSDSGHLELPPCICCIPAPSLAFRIGVRFETRFDSVAYPKKGLLQCVVTGVFGTLVSFDWSGSLAICLEVRSMAFRLYIRAQANRDYSPSSASTQFPSQPTTLRPN